MAVPAAIEAVTFGFPAREAGIGQTPRIMAKARLGTQAFRILSHGDHHRARIFGTYAFEVEQIGGELLDQWDDEAVEFSDLVVEVHDSASEGFQVKGASLRHGDPRR